MVTSVLISSDLLGRIVTETTREPGVEACGLLFGDEHAITAFRPAPSVAADPSSRFEIDPATLLAAHRAQRGGGPCIVGCYHSHPGGSPNPSRRDAADAAPNGWLWLIVAGGEARLWRAVPNGAVHGRFDPVPLACAGGPAPPESVGCARG